LFIYVKFGKGSSNLKNLWGSAFEVIEHKPTPYGKHPTIKKKGGKKLTLSMICKLIPPLPLAQPFNIINQRTKRFW